MANTSPSTSNLRFPDWQLAYQAALLEVDPQKLLERVKAAEAAIFLRQVPTDMRSGKPSRMPCAR